MKRYFLFLLLALLPMLANAYDAYIDGIYYNFSGNNATVTYRNSNYNSYSGTVVIPEIVTYNGNTFSVTGIGSSAFRDCSSLTSVTIGDNVTSIGNYAFRDCSSLTSVTIGDNVTSIGSHAFRDCSSLTSITIPNSVTSIGNYAFRDCSGLVSVTLKSNAIVSESLRSIFGAQVKEYVIGEGVTCIGDYAFESCSGLTSITIPNSVTSIGEYAFSGCTSLQKVIVPDVAAWCAISFGTDANPLNYAKHLFSDEETEITNLVIPEGVTSIGSYAFSGCSGLTSITISNSVTSIGYAAFSGCSGLTSITIGDNVTSIGYFAFYGCSGLTSVTIPNSVTSIDYYAFAECSGLTSVTIPNSVTSIGDEAFYGCSGLTSITIPNSVTSIGYSAFYGCSGLVSVTLKSNAIVSLDRSYSSSLGSVFGAQVKEYVIGEGVTSIGDLAFFGCSGLTSITIPNSVTSIGDEAFNGCRGLTNLISKATTPPLCGWRALEDINKRECTLSVPRGYIAAYQQADQWKDFFFMEEKSFEDAIVDVKADDVEETGYYDLQGRKQSAPQKGFNIIRYSDGTSKKVFVK